MFRSIALALLLSVAIGPSRQGALHMPENQAVSGLVTSCLRDLTAMLPVGSSPTESTISATAGFRG